MYPSRKCDEVPHFTRCGQGAAVTIYGLHPLTTYVQPGADGGQNGRVHDKLASPFLLFPPSWGLSLETKSPEFSHGESWQMYADGSFKVLVWNPRV